MQENNATKGFKAFLARCPYRVEVELSRRPGNCIAVEIGQLLDRCALKVPENWKRDARATASRWILSGGSPLVLGACSIECALGHHWCTNCGHLLESHGTVFAELGHCLVEWCGCTEYAGAGRGSAGV